MPARIPSRSVLRGVWFRRANNANNPCDANSLGGWIARMEVNDDQTPASSATLLAGNARVCFDVFAFRPAQLRLPVEFTQRKERAAARVPRQAAG